MLVFIVAKLVLDEVLGKNNIGVAIEKEIKKHIKDACIVSPYISDIDTLLKLSNIENMRLICDADSNSCNPYTLKKLMNYKGFTIKSRRDIHAKVYIFDNSAFVTSANATYNGLGKGTIEAAVRLDKKETIKDLKVWFNTIWESSGTENVSTYSESKWQFLESKWNLRVKGNEKPDLYDLLVTKTIPNNISFQFWHETKEAPTKEEVEKEAKKELLELPDNIDLWDYWIESANYVGVDEYNLLGDLLKKYYNHNIINIKANNWPCVKFYQTGRLLTSILDKPVLYNWDDKDMILSFYRPLENSNMDFTFKKWKRFIALLNQSIKINKSLWESYFSSEEGRYGFCSTNMLYKLTDKCFIVE